MTPVPTHPESATRRRWRLSFAALLVAVLVIGGTVALNYPNAADWVNQARFNQLINRMRQENPPKTPEDAAVRDKELADAHAYNDQLNSGALIAANERVPIGAHDITPEAHRLYLKTLARHPQGLMGSVNIPRIKTELPIYHGTSDDVLLKGVGHLEGTSLPVGDVGTHTVLTAHRGLAQAKLFTDLDKVRTGDQFILVIEGEVISYKVFSIKVVDPKDTESLATDPSRDLATLVTCTPLGVNSQRILVTGERVIPTPDDAQRAAKENPPLGFPWWMVFDSLAIVLSGLYMWRGGLYRPVAGASDAPARKLIVGVDGDLAVAFARRLIDEGGHHLTLLSPDPGAAAFALGDTRSEDVRIVFGNPAEPDSLEALLSNVEVVYVDPTSPESGAIDAAIATARGGADSPRLCWLRQLSTVTINPNSPRSA